MWDYGGNLHTISHDVGNINMFILSYLVLGMQLKRANLICNFYQLILHWFVTLIINVIVPQAVND